MKIFLDFVSILILPSVMIVIGTAILNGARVKKNNLLGYRTPRSMRCVRSWSWAQSMLGEYLLYDGAVLIAVSPVILATLLIISGKSDFADSFNDIIALLQIVTTSFVVIRIENNLKKEQNRWEIR